MTNKRKNTGVNKQREESQQSETSYGTEQLQAKASKTTENTFAQMLSRSM
jgi:hypothetical protein